MKLVIASCASGHKSHRLMVSITDPEESYTPTSFCALKVVVVSGLRVRI